MEQDRDAGGLPVGEHVAHVLGAGLGALDQDGIVADRLLLGVDLDDVVVHRLGPELDVPDTVVGERVGVGLPERHGVRHQPAHGGLEVVVADDPAGDAGGAGPDVVLVDDDDVATVPEVAVREGGGQVPGGGQAVDTGADDHVAG